MENTKIEVLRVDQVVQQTIADQLQQLSELQLAVVGGGGGDVVFA